MNKRDAKRLGRWCYRHGQVHTRVALENGSGWATGCAECLNEPETRRALAQLAVAAMRHVEQTHTTTTPEKEA